MSDKSKPIENAWKTIKAKEAVYLYRILQNDRYIVSIEITNMITVWQLQQTKIDFKSDISRNCPHLSQSSATEFLPHVLNLLATIHEWAVVVGQFNVIHTH